MLKFFLTILVFLSAFTFSPLDAIDSNDYQNNSDLQFEWAMASLEAFPFNQNDKVLDIGCGTGSITVEIAAKVPSGIVVGLDISYEMISYANEHYSSSNIIYMQGDARELPFVEQFDKIVAFLSMNWIKEQQQALDSLYAALKPTGKAIITLPGKQPSNLGPIVYNLVKEDRWVSYFPDFQQTKYYYSGAAYRELLENAGFIVEKLNHDSTSTHFKDREALVGFFRPLCNFINHLSPSQQEQFINEIVDVVLTTNPILPDGSILLHDFKIEAIISKPYLL